MLTFFTESNCENSVVKAAKQNLQLLVERTRLATKGQLICLLTGPGGSGKSTGIGLVQLYAK